MRTVIFRLFTLCVLVLGGLGSPRLAQAAAPQHLRVALISEEPAVVPGQSSWLGLHFRLDPKWHVYWVNPGDSGLAPKIEWQLPPGFSVGTISWPVPQRITLGPLVNYGYEDEVLLMMPLTAPANLNEGGKVHLAGTAKWLVCSDICIPGEAPVSLDLPVKASGHVPDPAMEPLFAKFRERLPQAQPVDWKPQLTREGDTLELRFSHAPAGTPTFYPLDPMQVKNGAPQEATNQNGNVTVRLKKFEELTTMPQTFRGVVSFDGGASYQIEAPVGAAVGSAKQILGMILFAFLGGMILNLMPCVFPVLSIKVLSFLNQGQEEKAAMRMHGFVYSLGILVSFWTLVAVLLVLRSGGEQLGWGFQLQSPGFLAFLAIVLFLFGLSLAGVFEVGSSFAGVGGGLAAKSGYTGSFFTGVLATVVATPCSAPFMGSAVGFALSQPVPIAFSIFTSLALGLALPYVVLSFNPHLGRYLPRPGRWMETLKQFMSFLVFGTVIWLLWVFGLQVGMSGVTHLLTALLLVSMAAWMLGRWQGQKSYTVAAMMVIAGALTVGLESAHGDGAGAAMADETAGGMKWEKFSPEKVTAALDAGKPVFVDFTAAWCLTCQANELLVFRSDEVKQKFKDLGAVMLKADWTSHDPVITRSLASFGRSGVPFYVLYDPKSREMPHPFPELINPTIVMAELNKIKAK